MRKDFLEQFLGNPARARVLRLLNSGDTASATTEDIAKKIRAPRATVARELAALKKLAVVACGKGKVWTLDTTSSFAPALTQFIQGVAPMKHESIVSGLKGVGRVGVVVISGSFLGDASRPADLIIVGDGLQAGRLERAVRALEAAWGREIRYAAFPSAEFRYRLTVQDRLIRDILDFPHRVLLDKGNILG